MKLKSKIITGASVASLLALSALAQDSTAPRTADQNHPDYRRSHERGMNRLNETAKASDIIGLTVKNYQGEKLGKVEDLAVDVESGRIVQVIISTGGLMGVGSSLTAVPPGALHHDVSQKVLHLSASKEKFAAAPKFDSANWDAGTQSNRVSEVYGYYGQQPYFVGDQDGYPMTYANGTLASQLPRNMDGTINTDGSRSMDKVNNEEAARNAEATNNWTSTRNPDGTWSREYDSNKSKDRNSWSRLGSVQKASKLMGKPVKNLQGENLGKVENLIVDVTAGRIVAVIISSGGFLGIANELSAVPPAAFNSSPQQDTLQLDTTKQELASSPHFQAQQWPNFSQSDYAGGVYQAYKVEPYFNTGSTNQPDNTARNVRDRNNRTLTPLDQGNSQSDVSTTAQIRKEIIASEGMSVNGKNVKIITVDGHVTLRGPVGTLAEKQTIGEIATRIARNGGVDNQLEVPVNTSSNN